MAEDAKRMDQYSYAATSNLVLSSNKSRPREGAGKEAVSSLWGKTAGTRMGDAVRSDGPRSNKKMRKEDSKNDNTTTKPTTSDDKHVSPQLLKCLRDALGHQLPYETLKTAHDEGK